MRSSWRRRLWGGVTGVSLLLCLASAVMWARCYLMPQTQNDALIVWKVEVAGGQGRQRVLRVCSDAGVLHADYDSNGFGGPGGATTRGTWAATPWQTMRVPSRSLLTSVRGTRVAGFRFWTEEQSGRPWGSNHTTDSIGVSVPYWAMTLVFGVLPARWFWGKRRSDGDRVAGRCARCGYDLRATPGRCPECGAVSSE